MRLLFLVACVVYVTVLFPWAGLTLAVVLLMMRRPDPEPVRRLKLVIHVYQHDNDGSLKSDRGTRCSMPGSTTTRTVDGR